jgi:hypothetical protein
MVMGLNFFRFNISEGVEEPVGVEESPFNTTVIPRRRQTMS